MPDEPVNNPPADGQDPAATPAPEDSSNEFAALLTQMFPDGVIPQGDEPPAKEEEPKSTAAVAAVAPEVDPKPDAKEPVKADKPELTDAQLEEAEKRMTVQAGTAFKHVKNELKAEREARAAMEKELQELRSKQPEPGDATDDVTTLKQQLERYETELAAVRIEATDEYQRTVAAPLEQAQASLAALAKKYDVSESDISAALRSVDPATRTDKLSELSSGFNRMDLVRFDKLVGDVEALEQRKAEIQGNAKGYTEKLQRDRAQQQKEAQVAMYKEWRTALDKSFEQLEADLPMFRKTGDAEFDAKITAARGSVNAVDLSNIPPVELATHLHKAAVFPVVLDMVGDLYRQNLQLTEKLTKTRGATPGAGAGASTPPSREISPDASLEEVFRSALAEAGIPG